MIQWIILVIFMEDSVRASPACLPDHRYRLGAAPAGRKKLVRTPTAAQRDVTRARIVLLAARRLSNNQIATRLVFLRGGPQHEDDHTGQERA